MGVGPGSNAPEGRELRSGLLFIQAFRPPFAGAIIMETCQFFGPGIGQISLISLRVNGYFTQIGVFLSLWNLGSRCCMVIDPPFRGEEIDDATPHFLVTIDPAVPQPGGIQVFDIGQCK